jgi:uncharacterized protein
VGDPGRIVRAGAWAKDDPPGAEFAEIALEPGRLDARGVAIGTEPVPYQLEYALRTASDFVTERLQVMARGAGWRRALDLRRGADGAWSVDAEAEGDLPLPDPGGDVAEVAGALDCDLALSPVTNMMPIRRHDLMRGGGPVELTMAWVSVPDLGLIPDGQRYRFISAEEDRSVVRFEAVDGTFAGDITLDREGLVVDFPGIARRLR